MTPGHCTEELPEGASPEDPAEALAWIAGREDAAGSLTVVSPATGAPLARLAGAGAAEVAATVATAAAALPGWQARPGPGRAEALGALARRVRRDARRLSLLQTLETGRPIREARGTDLPLALRHLDHAADLAEGLDPGAAPGGLCGLLLPAIRPLPTLARLAAPALAAGNAVVVKPAPSAPLAALALAELAQAAGLPLWVLPGDPATGAALAAHPAVGRLALVGSAEAGRALRLTTAGRGVGLALDLGGPWSLLVLPDADLDSAAEAAAEALRLGQALRLMVQEGVAPRFARALDRQIAALRPGDPLDPSTDCPAPLAAPEVETFRTPREGADLANAIRFGAAAAVWTEDAALAADLSARLAVGSVWINAVGLSDPATAAEPHRESGFGLAGGATRDPWLGPAGGPSAAAIPAAPPAPDALGRAVETARAAAAGWAATPAPERARVLRGLADTLPAACPEADPAGLAVAVARIRRLAARTATAPAGTVDPVPFEGRVTSLAVPLGVIGILCPDEPALLGLVGLVVPALAAGNVCVVVPAEGRSCPLTLPPGLLTSVAGPHAGLGPALAGHLDVDAVWSFSDRLPASAVERESVGNLKRTWTGRGRDWRACDGTEPLRHAVALRSIWLPAAGG